VYRAPRPQAGQARQALTPKLRHAGLVAPAPPVTRNRIVSSVLLGSFLIF
jgi:hypothetical protein